MRSRVRAPFVVVIFLCLAACGERVYDVTGTWEGESGHSSLVFKFAPDGAASISVTSGNQMSTTFCRWTLIDRRISITNARGQVRWFAIVESGKGHLLLRLDSGPAGLCHMRRVGNN